MITAKSKSKLPADWEVVRLDTLCDKGVIELTRGEVISEKDMQETPGTYPVYSSSIQNEGLFGRLGRYMFDEELITWSVDGGGNFFYRPKHKFSATNVVGILRLHSKDMILKFLYYLLFWQHKHLVFDYAQKAHPSVIKELYYVAYPELPEQQKIVYVLDTIQEAIGVQEKLIEKTKELKRAMMAKLFREGTRGEKLKKTEIGEIPESWEVMRLDKIFKIVAGGDISKLNFSSMKTDKFIYPIYSNTIDNNGLYGFANTYQFEGNCITVTARGTIGYAIPRFEKFNAIIRLLVLIPKINLNIIYVSEFTNEKIRVAFENTSIPQLTVPRFSTFKIPLPSFPEQQEIAEILQTIDQKIEIEQKKKALYEELFRAMLEKLMTAEIRVKDIEFE